MKIRHNYWFRIFDNFLYTTSTIRKFREAKMHMVQSAAFSLANPLTYEERMEFTHQVAAPKLYKYSDAAYYSESEYTADDWKMRYCAR